MTAVTINESQRLFVIPCGKGYSCLGFDVVFKRLRDYCSKLGRPAPAPEKTGTLEQYTQFREVEAAYIQTAPQDTQFDPDTHMMVKLYLEAYRKTGAKVRLFFGDVDTGRDWLSEHDVLGRISRTTGPLKAPILVEENDSGGGIILSACVLKIVDVTSKELIWQHPNYQEPSFDVKESSTVANYAAEVWVDGACHARFKSVEKANNWKDFMRGARMRAY